MGETLTIGLTKQQRDLLLRGLRYVRSSVLLEPRDPSPEVDEDRGSQISEIAALVRTLTGAESKAASLS